MALVLPRLYVGWFPLLRGVVVVCTSVGFGLVASMVRSAVWPVPPGAAADAWVAGSIAYLVAGAVAALLAAAAYELRVSSFAWNTPELARRVRREISLGGVVVFLVGAVAGVAIHGALTGESWFLAIAAALGFTIGLVNSLCRLMWARFGGTLGMVLAVLPLFFMPEIARLTASSGFLWCMFAASAVLVAADRLGRVLERRGDAPDPSEDGGFSAQFGLAKMRTRRAPRDGADGFDRVRSSNGDWVRALLHEHYGVVGGGLVGSAIRLGLATVIVTLFVRGFFRALSELHVFDATTGAAPTPETTHFTAVQAGLSTFSIEWILQPLPARNEELIAVNLVAVIISIVVWNNLVASTAFRYPISRRRLAWIGWLKTQMEEAAAFVGVLAGFVALGFVAARHSGGDGWASVLPFVTATVSVFMLLPVLRWLRLRLVDARRPTQKLDPATEMLDPRILAAYALSVSVIVVGAFLLTDWWEEGTRHLRAGTAGMRHVWMPLLVLVPTGLLRWFWLVELRKYYRRSDLA